MVYLMEGIILPEAHFCMFLSSIILLKFILAVTDALPGQQIHEVQ